MNNIIVEVFLPANGHKYDIRISGDMLISDITEMVSEIVTELAYGQFRGDANTVLCNAETGEILNINLSAREQGIFNASKLMLI